MRILVTGGAGFIGSHLVDKLFDYGHSVWVIDNLSTGFHENLNEKALKNFNRIDLRKRDVLNFVMKLIRPEMVFHFADFGGEKIASSCPTFVFDNNLGGSINLLSAAIRQGVRKFVFFSSGAFKDGTGPYSISKLSFEKLLIQMSFIHRFDYQILKSVPVFGERMALHDPYRESAEVLFRNNKNKEELLGELRENGYIYVKELIKKITDIAFDQDDRNNTHYFSGFDSDKIKENLQKTLEWIKEAGEVPLRELPFIEIKEVIS